MNEGHNIFKVTDQGRNGHTIQHVVLPDLLELFNHLLEKCLISNGVNATSICYRILGLQNILYGLQAAQ